MAMAAGVPSLSKLVFTYLIPNPNLIPTQQLYPLHSLCFLSAILIFTNNNNVFVIWLILGRFTEVWEKLQIEVDQLLEAGFEERHFLPGRRESYNWTSCRPREQVAS